VLPELTTNQKGAAAEWAIIHLATRLGVEVYRPIFEGGRFDLILAPGTGCCGSNANGLSDAEAS